MHPRWLSLRSAAMLPRSHHLNDWEWLCSNTAWFMNIETWILYDLHMSGGLLLLLIVFSSWKMWPPFLAHETSKKRQQADLGPGALVGWILRQSVWLEPWRYFCTSKRVMVSAHAWYKFESALEMLLGRKRFYLSFLKIILANSNIDLHSQFRSIFKFLPRLENWLTMIIMKYTGPLTSFFWLFRKVIVFMLIKVPEHYASVVWERYYH